MWRGGERASDGADRVPSSQSAHPAAARQMYGEVKLRSWKFEFSQGAEMKAVTETLNPKNHKPSTLKPKLYRFNIMFRCSTLAHQKEACVPLESEPDGSVNACVVTPATSARCLDAN